MAKLKKILAAVLVASLLTGFSASIASFAADEDWRGADGTICRNRESFTNAENYIEEARYNVYEFRVKNSEVAKEYEISSQDDGTVIYGVYDCIDHYLIWNIACIDKPLSTIYVPENFFGKPVVVKDDVFVHIINIGKIKLCVPQQIWACLQERTIKNSYNDYNVEVSSYENNFFVDNL